MTAPISFSELVLRAICLGGAGMVIAPMATFVVSRPILLATGVCDLPVFCDIEAGDIAFAAALPGLVAGAGLSLYLDRRIERS